MQFAVILIAHWIGDYVFQSSKMALNKGVSFKWLGIHVATYSLILGIFAFFLFPINEAILFVVINGLLHLITDFFTSKLALKYQDKARLFYPVLGFDQLVHGLCLYLTYLNIDNLI